MKEQTSSFKVAQCLWAVAVFFSFLSSTYDSSKLSFYPILTDILPFVCAFIFLLNRSLNYLFIASTLAYIYSCFFYFPIIPNHRYVLLCATILMLLPFLFSKKENRNEFFEKRIIPALTIELAIVYFFAFFTKLNFSYLNQDQSCAVTFYHHITNLNKFLPENSLVNNFSIYGSIIVELLLLGAVFTKYKNIAVFVGLVFHFVLSLDLFKYFTNFSSVMFLLLVVSGGKKWLEEIELMSESVSIIFRSNLILKLIFVFSVLLVWYLSYLVGTLDETEKQKNLGYFIHFRHLLWLVYSVFIFSVSLKVIKSSYLSYDYVSSFKLLSIETVLLFLVFFNGITTFIGLKTRTGFNMYSNLRVEPDFSNHFLVNKNPDIAGYLSDIAVVVGEPDKLVCKNVLFNNAQYPIFEILRAIVLCPEEKFSFHYENKTFESDSEETRKLIEQKTNWILRKLLAFKPMGIKSETECIW